jgi:hypothetical protein
VPTGDNRKRIDDWIALAPDTRLVETTQEGDRRWVTQALEDGEVRYEETDFGDEPELGLLAAWCERQGRVTARPPAKTNGAPIDVLERKRQG